MSEFKKRVLKIITEVPYGTVVSYGQVAIYAGAPRAARQVGWILNQTEGKISVPWWRVVNNQGRISIKGTRYNTPEIMKKLLESEGVKVNNNMEFNIEEYRFRASEKDLKRWKLPELYIEKIHQNYLNPKT
jgi:methylated-DNA-protein-cysteine methyltransferase-like protein